MTEQASNRLEGGNGADPIDEVRRLDRAIGSYLAALDDDDGPTLARLWQQAETDPALEHALHEADECLLLESGTDPSWAAGREAVQDLVRSNLPSVGFGPSQPAALTVGDVAARLAGDVREFNRLAPADRAANAALLGDGTPLPPVMTGPALAQLQAVLNLPAGPGYWRAFQQAAVLLNMSRARATTGRAAARPSGRAGLNDPSGKRGPRS